MSNIRDKIMIICYTIVRVLWCVDVKKSLQRHPKGVFYYRVFIRIDLNLPLQANLPFLFWHLFSATLKQARTGPQDS
jgi:hypothetical protein